MGRDMVSRFSPTVYHGMGRIVSEKGRDETLVVAETCFLYLECVPFVSFGVDPARNETGFYGTHQCH